jgi:hypothetical protein
MFRPALILLFITTNAIAQSTDYPVLMEIWRSSQNAVGATLELLEVESKNLKKLEEARRKTNETHSKAMDIKYFSEETAGLVRSLDKTSDVYEYTSKVNRMNNTKNGVRGYAREVEEYNQTNEYVTNKLKNSSELSKRSKKYADNVAKDSNYSGSNASTNANVDSSRKLNAINDQLTALNNNSEAIGVLSMQQYREKKLEKLKEQKNKFEVSKALGLIPQKVTFEEYIMKANDGARHVK